MVEINNCIGFFKKKKLDFNIVIPSYEPTTDAIRVCAFRHMCAKNKMGKRFGCWELATQSHVDSLAEDAGACTRGKARREDPGLPMAQSCGQCQKFKAECGGYVTFLPQSKEKQG